MILAGGIIGGAPRLAADITLISHTNESGQDFTLSGLSWGNTVKRPNRRSVLVTLVFSSDNISGTPTIAGLNATVIYNALTDIVNSLRYRCVAFTVEVPTGSAGDVTFSLSSSVFVVRVAVFRVINLDVSVASDSDIGAGTGAAALSLDCPANGWIVGSGAYAYSSGSTPTSAPFVNLSTLSFLDSSQGGTAAASGFAMAQTALDVTYDPTPNTNITRSHAFALSFARTY